MKSARGKRDESFHKMRRPHRVTRQSTGHITPSSIGIADLLVDTPIVFQDQREDGTMTFVWTPESETILFKAMIKHKLVGIKKHFNVITVAALLTKAFGFKVNPECIWKHVKSLYSTEELEENNTPVIPGKPSDYSLPKSFDSIIALKSTPELEIKVSEQQQMMAGKTKKKR